MTISIVETEVKVEKWIVLLHGKLTSSWYAKNIFNNFTWILFYNWTKKADNQNYFIIR